MRATPPRSPSMHSAHRGRLPQPPTIEFDVKDLNRCSEAVREIYELIKQHHGPAIARRIFIAVTPTKRGLKLSANVRLMIAYRRNEQLGVDRLAAKLVEKNKTLPWEKRYGTGATDVTSMAEQIRRQKQMTQRPRSLLALPVRATEAGYDPSEYAEMLNWDLDNSK